MALDSNLQHRGMVQTLQGVCLVLYNWWTQSFAPCVAAINAANPPLGLTSATTYETNTTIVSGNPAITGQQVADMIKYYNDLIMLATSTSQFTVSINGSNYTFGPASGSPFGLTLESIITGL
jgi:hypothetical protein